MLVLLLNNRILTRFKNRNLRGAIEDCTSVIYPCPILKIRNRFFARGNIRQSEFKGWTGEGDQEVYEGLGGKREMGDGRKDWEVASGIGRANSVREEAV